MAARLKSRRNDQIDTRRFYRHGFIDGGRRASRDDSLMFARPQNFRRRNAEDETENRRTRLERLQKIISGKRTARRLFRGRS